MITDKAMVETLGFFNKQIKLQEIEGDIRSFLQQTKHTDHSVARYLIARMGLGRVKDGDETENNEKSKEYKFIKTLKKRLQVEKLNVLGDFINVLTNSYNRTEYKNYYKHLLLKELNELSRVNVNNWFDESRDSIPPELFEEACRTIHFALSELMKNVKTYPASLEEIKSQIISLNEAPVASYLPKVLDVGVVSEPDLPY
jgi:hypothetical protein